MSTYTPPGLVAPPPPTGQRPVPVSRLRALVAGAVGAGLGLTAGELVHRVAGSRIPAPVIAVGDSIIDLSPGSAVRTGIETLGTADKPTLIAATVVLTLLVGATIGHYARHSLRASFAAFGALTAVGAWAALRQPGASTIGVLLSAAGSAALATGTYRGLFAVARGAVRGSATSEAELGAQPGTSRRFLLLAGAGTALAALVPFALRRRNNEPTVQLADGQKPAVAVAPTGSLDGHLPGLSPYFMPNKDFYRIDTALSAPRVSASDWSLKIGGLVERPFSISYDELKALPSVEAPVTLSCVSNGVGQDLVGNALWRGVPLSALLERAGVQPKATQLASFSVDGWSCGFPVDAITPSRTVLVAYEMNGSPLPLEHGFPARLVVAGLYGYVSATKWLNKIELTTWEDFQGYWIPKGWSRRGPIKTQSKIDVPRTGAKVPRGTVGVGGVAWAPTVGIRAVEVRVDQGPWQPATLGAAASDETWVQWELQWEATPGVHALEVRATDGSGTVQTEQRTPVEPNGATGHHIIKVEVV